MSSRGNKENYDTDLVEEKAQRVTQLACIKTVVPQSREAPTVNFLITQYVIFNL